MDEDNKDYVEKFQKHTSKPYKDYFLKERISLSVVATACFYAERHSIPIVLVD